MINRLVNYFSDPGDSDESFIRLAQNIIIFATAATLISMAVVALDTNTPGFFVVIGSLLVSVLVELLALFYTRRGYVLPAKAAVPLVLTISVTIIALSGNSLHDISIIAYPVIIVVANLLQGRRSLLTTTPFVLLAVILLGVADILGMTSTPMAEKTGWDDILSGITLMIAGASMLYLLVQRLQSAVARAEANEKAQIQAIEELQVLQASLEKRVAERTTEIETANQRNERRARQFEAIAQVARATTVSQNLQSLLYTLTELISRQFGFYHVGIFLIDDQREFAVLSAANSEGGKRMLAREHKLGLGQSGIVGYVSATGKPRIALDVGADAAYFNNPELPATRSEMALPLRVIDHIIGVLDIQSKAANAFTEDDVDVLSTLADQVSVAIQNARSYDITQDLLAEAQQSSVALLRDSWRVFQSQAQEVGYKYSNNKLLALERPISTAHIQKVVTSRQSIKQDGERATLTVPVRIRDEVVGFMEIQVPDEHEWDADEVDIAEAVAERLSLALESTLLLKATQRRAEIERITADISSRISSSTQFDSILRTAAEELSRALGGSEVLVQLRRETFDDDKDRQA